MNKPVLFIYRKMKEDDKVSRAKNPKYESMSLEELKMRNSSYNKSVVRQTYISASQKDRQEIAEAVQKTEKGDDS